jgi:hypothetical protein
VNLEDPEFFNRVVCDFIAQVAAGSWAPKADIPARFVSARPRRFTTYPRQPDALTAVAG